MNITQRRLEVLEGLYFEGPTTYYQGTPYSRAFTDLHNAGFITMHYREIPGDPEHVEVCWDRLWKLSESGCAALKEHWGKLYDRELAKDLRRKQ